MFVLFAFFIDKERWWIMPVSFPCLTQTELTKRETEILKMLAHGLPKKAIAKDLRIAESTVRNHTQSIYKKFDTGDKGHTIFLACKQGIL